MGKKLSVRSYKKKNHQLGVLVVVVVNHSQHF